MKTNALPIAAVLSMSVLAVAAWFFFAPSEPTPPAPAPSTEPSGRTPVDRAPERLSVSATHPSLTQRISAEEAATPAPSPAVMGIAPMPVKAQKPKTPLQAPLARAAMCFVGMDADAESVWLEAIFNPNIPDQEREDLMEDLNEEGLSDHRRPGPGDYLLIVNRIALIDEILPDADKFMVRHLMEARKDLLNLAEVAQGAGKPVR